MRRLPVILALLLPAAATAASPGEILINEVVTGPDGMEWIELVNPGSSDVTLDNWTVEVGETAYATAFTFPTSTVISAGSHIVIAESGVATADFTATLALGDAASGADAVRLLDESAGVIDTVVYGPDNSTEAWLDDQAATAAPAPAPGDDRALARATEATDSDDSSVDFILARKATPGAANQPIQPGEVVINELLPDPSGGDTGNEFVELFNTLAVPVWIDGWMLEGGTSGYSELHTFGADTRIDAGGYYLIGETNITGADVTAVLAMGNAGSNSDAVRIVDEQDAPIDTVVYGSDNSDGWLDDLGATAAPAPDPVGGESLARQPDGADTDDSSFDFVSDPVPTPGAMNPDPPLCEPTAGEVLLNEFLVNPAGVDADVDLEWIELFNTGSGDRNLSGWMVETSTSGSWTVRATLDDTHIVGPGAWFVIGEPLVSPVDAVFDPLSLPSGSNGDGLRLVDCEGTIVDTVVYGPDNDDGIVDDSGSAATSVAPQPGEDESLARIVDGVDTDLSGDDWQIDTAPTIGADNPDPPACEPYAGDVSLNELLVNPTGTDADVDLEFVELYNAGSGDRSLEGWTIESASSDTWLIRATLGSADVIASGDWFVVGEPAVTGADVTVDPLALPGGTGGDGVRLVDCQGTVADVVVYGPNNDDGVTDESGSAATSVAPNPGEGDVLARIVDGVDTDMAGDDWAIAATATVGANNPDPAVCAASTGDVLLNEFLVNPAGVDGDVDLEFVELHNRGGVDQSLDGWLLETATSDSWSVRAAFTDADTIVAGDWYVVGEPAVVGADLTVDPLSLPSGSGGDGLRLVDCDGTVVDVVVYGPNNDDGITDESGSAATSVAPSPGEDDVLARILDGVDTDQAGDDWTIASGATIGGDNPEPPLCEPLAGAGIVVNEFLANPAGADSTAMAEWVELYNGTGAAINLSGWTVQTATSADNWTVRHSFDDTHIIADADWLLLGEANVGGADVVTTLGLGSGSSGDGVRLVDCAGTVVDTALYGNTNDDGMLEDSGSVGIDLPPSPSDDCSIVRRFDGDDTNDSGADFYELCLPTPGAANPPPPVCEPGAVVVVNEFVSDPEGSDAEVLLEWVELYNPGTADVRLDGWAITAASSEDSYAVKAALPAETTIAAGDYLLVGEPNVAGADVIDEKLGLGSGSGGDGIRLIDCEGTAIDTVVYGIENEDAVWDDSGDVATSLAAAPGSGHSAARRENGVDTDDSAADFVVSPSPTPGAANPLVECFPSDGSVVINEFLPDPGGSDGDVLAEWVELYNAGSEPVRIDSWSLVFASKNDEYGPDVTLPGELTIGPGEWFVIGDQMVESADVTVGLSITNGGGGDTVRLLDCEGATVDVVVYGGVEDGHTDENGNVAGSSPNPGSDFSLARVDDGVDSNHPDDWFLDRSPTPGESNFQEIVTDTGGDEGSNWGCGGGAAPDGGAPDGGGCRTAPPPGGGMGLALVLLGLLRRRDRHDPR